MTAALIAWELWFIVSVWRGGALPVPIFDWNTDNGHPIIAVILLLVGAPFLGMIGFAVTAAIAGPLVLAFGRVRHQPVQQKLALIRHVSLTRDGKGATFEMHLVDGKPDWRWTYDSGTPDDSFTMIATEKAITDIERELGLPLTFETRGAPNRRPANSGQRNEGELQRAASEGNAVAQIQLWFSTGRPIHDPTDLVGGTIYCLSFDLARYEHSFTGRRWEGFPDLDDEPELALWHAFEPAESGRSSIGKAGARYRDSDLRSSSKQMVVLPTAPQAEVQRVFDRLRAEHLDLERRNPPKFHA